MEKGQNISSGSSVFDDTLFGSNESLSSLLDQAAEPNDPNFESTRDVFNSPEDFLEKYRTLHSNQKAGIPLSEDQLVTFLDQASEEDPTVSPDLEIL